MSLVIETGAGLSSSESYASVVQLKAYALKIGATVPGPERECEILLRKAMLPLRRGDEFKGCRATRDQSLDFPRIGVCIERFSYSSSELPPMLIEAQCLFAIAANTIDLLPIVKTNAPGAVIERTVGPITTKYADPGMISAAPKVQAAERVLAPLLKATGGSVRVVRA